MNCLKKNKLIDPFRWNPDNPKTPKALLVLTNIVVQIVFFPFYTTCFIPPAKFSVNNFSFEEERTP